MGKILPSLRQEPRSVRPFSIRLDNITTEIYTTLPARNPMCVPEIMSLEPCAASPNSMTKTFGNTGSGAVQFLIAQSGTTSAYTPTRRRPGAESGGSGWSR
jgi:hypothetical protein